MKRKWMLAIIASLVTAAIVVPITAWAIKDRGASFSSVDRQDFRWRAKAVATSSTDFSAIPGLTLTTCNRGGLTVAVSGDLSGAPVDIRVVKSPGGNELVPGVAHFAATNESSSLSFIFGHRGGRRATRTFEVQWRSANGQEAILNHALARVLYNRAKKVCL